MTSTSYNIPLPAAGDSAGGKVSAAYVPGTGHVPLRGGTANSVSDNEQGMVTLTALLTEYGGTAYKACAAATAVAVKASAGRLVKLIVIATGTAAVSIYDNPSAASGTVLFTIPANAAVGTIYDLWIPATTGIYVGGTTNTPQLLVTYY